MVSKSKLQRFKGAGAPAMSSTEIAASKSLVDTTVESAKDESNADSGAPRKASTNDRPKTAKLSKAAILKLNDGKPRTNLCKISKFIHVLIFEFFDLKTIIKVSGVCRSLKKSSEENGVWEKHFPNQRRLREFQKKYGFRDISKRDLFIHDMKVIINMTRQKNRYQNFNLEGHTDSITALDVRNGIIASGSNDSIVKLWDIDKKKGWTFKGHQNKVQHVILWDDYSVLSGSIDRSIRFFDLRDWSSDVYTEDVETLNGFQYSKLLRGHTKSITSLRRLNNSHSRIVSSSDDATIKIWDLNSNIYCDLYSNSNVVGHRLNENTEIIEPLESIEGDHKGGIRAIAMN